MFRNGDIVVVYNPKSKGENIGTHPFIVIDNKEGKLGNDSYDFIGVCMSSMTTEHKIEKANKYFSNFILPKEDLKVKGDKHIKTNVLPSFAYLNEVFFISTDELRVKRIGKVTTQAYDAISKRMEQMQKRHIEIKKCDDNAKKNNRRKDDYDDLDR